MSALSESEILEFIRSKELIVEGLTPSHIQLGSIDLTLGNTVDVLSMPEDFVFDCSLDVEDILDQHTKEVSIKDGYDLRPGEFVVGHSAEHIRMPKALNGIIVNRNSFARIGIDAGISQYINPGFEGNKIIVIKNNSPFTIKIKPGIRICSLILFRMGEESMREFSERHNTTKIVDFIKKQGSDSSFDLKDKKDVDTSLSDYMDMRIKEISEQ